MSLFGDALGTVLGEIHRAQGSPSIVYAGASVDAAVFDERGLEVSPEGGILVRTGNPQLGVRLSDLAKAPEQGDDVTVNGVAYLVTDVNPDGEGGALLDLRRAP